jgi:hypothetical protein
MAAFEKNSAHRKKKYCISTTRDVVPMKKRIKFRKKPRQ